MSPLFTANLISPRPKASVPINLSKPKSRQERGENLLKLPKKAFHTLACFKMFRLDFKAWNESECMYIQVNRDFTSFIYIFVATFYSERYDISFVIPSLSPRVQIHRSSISFLERRHLEWKKRELKNNETAAFFFF